MATHAEKQASVLRLLEDPIWRNRSTCWLARAAGVSWGLADKMRIRLGLEGSLHRETSHGRTHPRSKVRRHHARRGHPSTKNTQRQAG